MAPWGRFVNPLGPNPVPLTKLAPWGQTYARMPPAPITTLEQALDLIYSRNEKRGKGPVSLRALAREMTILRGIPEPTHQDVEQDRRYLRRLVSGDRGYTEETRRRIAKAANARLSEIPKSPSMAELRRLVVDQARELQRIEEELRAAQDRSATKP